MAGVTSCLWREMFTGKLVFSEGLYIAHFYNFPLLVALRDIVPAFNGTLCRPGDAASIEAARRG